MQQCVDQLGCGGASGGARCIPAGVPNAQGGTCDSAGECALLVYMLGKGCVHSVLPLVKLCLTVFDG
jgi:hypothetical protein